MKPTVMRANPDEDYYLLESRVRENCMHGSVGGEDVSPSLPNQKPRHPGFRNGGFCSFRTG